MNPLVPPSISIAFLLAICIPVYLIARLAQRHAAPQQSKSVFYAIMGFYITYLLVVGWACLEGWFREVTLPPRIVQLTTLPLLVFLLGGVFHTGAYKRLLKAIPLDQLISLHRFRLIGSFFLILWFLQLLPPVFAWIAGIGDIVTALSSIWLARRIRVRNEPTRWVVAWNSFGLLDILATSTMAILLTKVSMETGALGVDVLATFPFCFIPAFAPATIIFLHLSIYRKLFVKKFH